MYNVYAILQAAEYFEEKWEKLADLMVCPYHGLIYGTIENDIVKAVSETGAMIQYKLSTNRRIPLKKKSDVS